MRGFANVVIREIERIRSRFIYALILFILPLGSFGVFIAIFHSGVSRDLPVAVLDLDNSLASRKIVRMIDALPSAHTVYAPADLLEGKHLLASGDAYALVLIPRNFSNDLFSGRDTEIVNFYNNQYLLIGGILNRDIYSAVKTFSAGAALQKKLRSGVPYRAAVESLQAVKVQNHILFNPYTNYLYYLAASLLPTMLHIFVILSAIFSFGTELKDGTSVEWLKRSGENLISAIFGKLIPYTVSFMLTGILMNILLFYLLGVPLLGSFFKINIATLMLILSYQSMGLFFIAMTANLRKSLMNASFYATTAYTFVGMTFPIIAMPLPARIWAELLPLTHFMRIFLNESLRGGSSLLNVQPFGILLLFTLLPWLFTPRLKRIFTERRYWGHQ